MRALVSAATLPHAELAVVPDPKPLPHEALVAVRAFSLNRGEVRQLASKEPGTVTGWDLAGVVRERAGDGSGPAEGARVVGMVQSGAWAELAAVRTDHLAVLPDEVSFEQAAALPVAGLTALLTSETGNTAKIVKYINECREMGIKILPPDVNHSEWSFTPDGEAIRFGMGAIKNLGQSAVEAIGRARAEVGRFTSLHQFCEKVDLSSVNRRMIESLIKAGAMDSEEGTRSQKWAAVEGAMDSEEGTRSQ